MNKYNLRAAHAISTYGIPVLDVVKPKGYEIDVREAAELGNGIAENRPDLDTNEIISILVEKYLEAV